MNSVATWFPPAGVVVRTPHLELRWLTDDDLVSLCGLYEGGIHPPETMPFRQSWTDTPSPMREADSLRYFWRCRAEWSPTLWDYTLGVHTSNGTLIGTQAIRARDFPHRRTVETGSWIARAHQGRGYGTEQRRAVLAFAFGALGAVRAESAAFADNAASLAVSHKLGYRDNGTAIEAPRGEAVLERRLTLDAADADPAVFDEVGIAGVTAETLLAFGADGCGKVHE